MQDILGTVNKSLEELSPDEGQLVQMSFGLLTDMVENQILQFSLAHKILNRKYTKLLRSVEKTPTLGYLQFLATCRWELEDFDLAENQYCFTIKPSRMDTAE